MKRIYMFIMTILCSIGIAIAISYAWFLNDENVDPIASGFSGSAYFAYGDGSAKHPYGINNPRHLYNLAWLCYLDNGASKNYVNKHYEIDPAMAGDLNMEGWVLPPIGTDTNPFIGYFNGNGKTITGLTTSNSKDHMNVKPNSITGTGTLDDCDVIGLFGKIAKANNETDSKYMTYI